MKNTFLLLLICICFGLKAQNKNDLTLNVGLKHNYAFSDFKQSKIIPTLSLQYYGFELNLISFSDDLKLPTSLRYYFGKSKQSFIGINRLKTSFSETKNGYITGIHPVGLDASGNPIYDYQNKKVDYELTENSKYTYLSIGKSIQAFKDLYFQVEFKYGFQKSNQTNYIEKINNPDDPESIENNYDLGFMKEKSFMVFGLGLELIYKIPL
ncbi:MAG: hypothetical protein ACPGTG_07755 [Flavobacteriales bacterium]